MNDLSGSTSALTLYAYGADGKLAKVEPALWTITDEDGKTVTELTAGTLYELRVTVADGGALDQSEEEKGDQALRCTRKINIKTPAHRVQISTVSGRSASF